MAKQETKGNQTEGEYFPVLTKGRAGMLDVFAKQHDELMRIASPAVRGDLDTWTARALVEITSREELHPLLQTRKGLFSIYKGLSKCAVMGIQFGGHFPQAYFMPDGDEAGLDITWEGFAFIAAYGPGALLIKAPALVRVYEMDHFGGINQAAGTVDHTYDPRYPEKRGKLVGWYMILEYRDGTREVPYVTVKKVQEINARYSKKETRKGGMMPAWAKSPEEMEDKTAAKQLLKKPAKMSEGLAMAISSDVGPVDIAPPEPPMRDVTDRTRERARAAGEALDPAKAKPAEEPAGQVHTGVTTGAASDPPKGPATSGTPAQAPPGAAQQAPPAPASPVPPPAAGDLF